MKRSHQKLWIRCSLALTLLASGMGHVYAQGPGPDTLTPQQWEDGGLAAITFNDYATAIGSFEQAVIGDPRTGRYVADLSDAYSHEGRFEDAKKLLIDRIPRFALEDRKVLRVCLAIVEDKWQEKLWKGGDIAGAIDHLKAAYRIDKDLRLDRAALDQLRMGDAFHLLNRFPDALAANMEALRLARHSRDSQLQTLALISRSVILRYTGRPQEALTYSSLALTSSRQYHQADLEYSVMTEIQEAYADAGDYEQSKTVNKALAAIEHRKNAPRLEIACLCQIGYCARLQNQFAESIQAYTDALAIAEAHGEPIDKAQALCCLGDNYRMMADFAQAREYYSRAIPIYEAAGDTSRALGCRINMHCGVRDRLEALQAVTALEPLLAEAQKNGDKHSQLKAWYALGYGYEYLDPLKQKRCFEEKLRIEKELGDSEAFFSLLALGYASIKLGEFHSAQGNFDEAIAMARQYQSPEKEALAATFSGMLCIQMHRNQEGVDLIKHALTLYHSKNTKHFEAFSLGRLMYGYSAMGKENLAIFYGKQTLHVLETIRADAAGAGPTAEEALLRRDEDTYRKLFEVLVQKGRLPEAQQIFRLIKRKEYRDFALRGGSDSGSPAEPVAFNSTEAAWRDRYAKISDQVTAIGKKREELLTRKTRAQIDPTAFTDTDKKTLAEVDRDLVVANTAFQKSLTKMAVEFAKPGASLRLASVGETSGLSDTLRNLGPGTVALYTIVEADKYRVIVITSQTQKAEEYPISSTALNKKIMALREALQDPSLDPRPLALELYKILIGPIEKDLAGAQAKTLMWSLDGALRYLPIAALYDGRQYLAERYRNEVFTLASQSRLEDTPAAHWSALGLGVSQAQPGFEALPSVPEELHGIIQGDPANANAVLPGAVLLDAAFTRDSMIAALEDRKYPVVHIASHFSFRPGSDADSFLLLGDGTHLTLADLKTLPQVFQGIDLLTLSACDTAMSAGGDGSGGREIEGCAVIAQRQGARSILASLWPVADESTQILMHAFYQWRESHPGSSKAEALQAAQLSLLHGEKAASAGAPRGAARRRENYF
ncbi:MAG: Tetratricopeptide 2 repeat protein [Capsulimonas sp.]|nr:Tetratricopeptide 2 repeat protein [Capsulimonas sp.]